MIQRNWIQKAQVKDKIRKTAVAITQVWSRGKRRFKRNWERRVWLFDRLVWTVIRYGVEIWGWEERKEMERLKKNYLRWVRCRMENTKIFGERRISEKEIKGKSRKGSVGI